MGYTVNGHSIWIVLLVSFFSSMLLVPFVKKLAFHIDAVDYPNARRINKVPMPDLGGLAVFFSFLFGFMLFGQASIQMISILMGSFLLILMGICDDVKPLGAKWQFQEYDGRNKGNV